MNEKSGSRNSQLMPTQLLANASRLLHNNTKVESSAQKLQKPSSLGSSSTVSRDRVTGVRAHWQAGV